MSIRVAAEQVSSEGVNMVEAIRQALFEEMAADSRVIVLGEDVGVKGGVFKATEGLQSEFGPLRVVDTPLAEELIAGAAIGAAMAGLRPVAEFQFADYIFPAYDQIVNQAATVRWRSVGGYGVPVVFRAPSGSGVQGGLYHSQSVEALFSHTPGLKVIAPATPRDAKGLLKAAIRDNDPVLFFEHKKSYRKNREVVPEGEILEIGRARLDRSGKHLSLITYGIGLQHCREAADVLAREAINAEVLDLRTLRPYDREAIARTVERTGRALIVHEAGLTMGIGAEIAAFIADEMFEYLDAPVRRLASLDIHLPYNRSEEEAIIPNAAKVLGAARLLVAY